MTNFDDRPPEDLGFGSVVARESRQRLLNRDGSFNVRREGLNFWQTLSFYSHLITVSWPKFLAYVAAAYFVINSLFALVYMACGDNALAGFSHASTGQKFWMAFVFSVQTMSTIGYGSVVPTTLAAEIVLTIEAMAGLLGFGVTASLMFARVSRPNPQIVFSRHAVIAPYRNITALMFRVVNQRKDELIDVAAQVLLVRRKKGGTVLDREFIALQLEREGVIFFPLAWTVVHPIDEKSPLWNMTEDAFRACDSEFLIRLSAFDETSSTTVHTRSSYKSDEVVWGARFLNMFNPPRRDGTISVNIRKVHEIERVALK